MTATIGRKLDGEALRSLREIYAEVQRDHRSSVRSSWRFGQRLDSYRDTYTVKQIADDMDLSKSTVQRYLMFFGAFQRPELAEEAAERLGTWNLSLIVELLDTEDVFKPGRTLAGTHWRNRCKHCGSTEVAREEITDAAELAAIEAQRTRREHGVSA